MIDQEIIQRALEAAADQLGKPYAIGGEVDGKWVVRGKPNISDPDPKEFDCSGLSRWVIGQCGIVIPHGCAAQIKFCKPIAGLPRPLDLGFADLRASDGVPDHVVIALADDNVIEARGKQVGKTYEQVILRPKKVWEAQNGWLGWYRVPGLYDDDLQVAKSQEVA